MHVLYPIAFDPDAGDDYWRKLVTAFDAARLGYVHSHKVEPAPLDPDGDGSRSVVSLSAYRHNLTVRDPIAVALKAYRGAALRLLRALAPCSDELRSQLRLSAELAGLPDPCAFAAPDRAEHTRVTPGNLVGMVYYASYGLLDIERRAARRHRP